MKNYLTHCVVPATLFAASLVSAQERDLAWGLSYEVLANECKAPVQKRANETGGQADRLQRRMKRYVACVGDYQEERIAEHQALVSLLSPELEEAQLEQIVGSIKDIETKLEVLSEDVRIGQDAIDIERNLSVPNRPSI